MFRCSFCVFLALLLLYYLDIPPALMSLLAPELPQLFTKHCPISSGSPSLPDLWSFLRHYIFPREKLISAYPSPPNLWRYLRCGIIYFKISGQPTLSQSKEAYYARQIILAPLDFQTFRRLCQLLFENTEQANLPLQFFANKEKRKE